MKGIDESNPNTILITATVKTIQAKEKREIWKLNNKDGWKQFKNWKMQERT